MERADFEVEPRDLELPEWSGYLLDPARHKVIHGGRGGAKSRSIARIFIHMARQREIRVLCAREIQKSIRQSVKRLLTDEIHRNGWGMLGDGFFTITEREIRGANGSLFTFDGLRHNAEGLKSLEDYTHAWVEEARGVSQASIDILTPTLRRPGSEIWWSYNPKFPTDPVDKLFRGEGGPPPRTIMLKVDWEHNPWFPAELREEMEWLKTRDPGKYQHIWRGEYLRNDDSRVFHNWIEADFDTPEDATFRFGADWGFSIDPTVLVRCFLGDWDGRTARPNPKGRTLFVDREAWALKCPIDDTPALFAGSDVWRVEGSQRWQNRNKRAGVEGALRWKIIADSSRPETIDYMCKRGFKVEPAIKGAGSVEEGVEFLQAYDIVVHPSCEHVIDELTLYSYKTDPLTEEVLPVLADKKNHTIDALRYALEGVRRAGSSDMTNLRSAGRRASLTSIDPARRLRDQINGTAGGGRGFGSGPSRRGW